MAIRPGRTARAPKKTAARLLSNGLPRRQRKYSGHVSGRRECRDVDLVLLNLRVEPRAVNPEQVRRGLLVAAGALERALDDELLDLFERHVGRHVPARAGHGLVGERAVVEGQIDGLD